MAPRNVGGDVVPLAADEAHIDDHVSPVVTEATNEQKRPPLKIKWFNVFWFIVLHLTALGGIYRLFFCHPFTWLWTILVYTVGGLGITAGAHRLWSHKSYKAKLPLRIFLAICNSSAFQNDIIDWARDHRVHHKYSETDADPHNAKRGFFFAHCGWLMCKKLPDVKEKAKNVDFSDLFADPVCIFQRKLYLPSVLLLCFFVPAYIPCHYWDESFLNAFLVSAILRYVILLNVTWCVNSAAHLWGNKPYDKHINPAENFFVTFGAIGEGFHNYHHTFPNDYSTSEYGWRLNFTTWFIDAMAKIGQAEQRKKMSADVVFKRKLRTGDGTTGFGVGQTPKLD